MSSLPGFGFLDWRNPGPPSLKDRKKSRRPTAPGNEGASRPSPDRINRWRGQVCHIGRSNTDRDVPNFIA